MNLSICLYLSVSDSLIFQFSLAAQPCWNRSDTFTGVLDGLGCQDDSKQTPESLAITCFRELMSRATYGHINSVIKPVLTHLDKHQLWAANDNTFAVHVFKIIMYSIQVSL